MKASSIEKLLGKTIVSIEGLEKDSDKVIIKTKEFATFEMYHEQECCESVSIEDVNGDVEDLIGSPILVAEEVNSDLLEPKEYNYSDSSYTWTFYKLATIKGYVIIRWLGESNGYYSESVNVLESNPYKELNDAVESLRWVQSKIREEGKYKSRYDEFTVDTTITIGNVIKDVSDVIEFIENLNN